MARFEDMGLSEPLLRALKEMKYEAPTPIQEMSLSPLFLGEDIIGQAETGSGKTAAFGIFLLEKIKDEKKGFPKVIILAPTRELAVQVSDELRELSKYLRLRVLPVYGGQPIDRQLAELQRGVDVVVGTPGRVIDHIERGTLRLDKISVLILDEADRMLDMGFVDDVEKIMAKTPKERQTLLFSATMPGPIMDLTNKYMRNPQLIKVRDDPMTVKNIEHFYAEVNNYNKLYTLLGFLGALPRPHLALIFVRTKRGVDHIHEVLEDRGFKAICLHGDMSQNKRDKVMEKFKAGETDILVATDVAARGIDVHNITHVINFDCPEDQFTYVHRVGRTGRIGNNGVAFTLVFGDQTRTLDLVRQTIGKPITKIEVDTNKIPQRVSGRREFGASRQRSDRRDERRGERRFSGSEKHPSRYSHPKRGAEDNRFIFKPRNK
ncbi:putative ATP-dependent RNA helicase [Candidatus Gugararchaeum adminiculabundum]|nr:putative ATP-dependent RNA helicase [Candidatus Gugararchaeum adminiculabundum]